MVGHYMTVERQGETFRLSFGFNLSLGFSLKVAHAGKLLVSYHSIVTDFTGLSGLLDALVDAGVFGRETIQEGLCAVVFGALENAIRDPEIRQTVNLVQTLLTDVHD